MNLLNLKIGIRLGIGFASVLILLVLISIIATTNMSSMNGVTDTLVNTNFAETKLAAEALDNVRGSIARVFEIVSTTNEENAKDARERLKTNTSNFDAAITELSTKVRSQEGKDLVAKIKESRDRYVASIQKTLDLVSTNRDEASKLAFGTTYKELHTFADSLRIMVDHQQKIFTNNGELSAQTYSSSRSQMIIASLIAVILGIAGALWITRSITKPINQAVFIAETIASGDLTKDFEAQSTDETGQLIQALHDMKESLVRIVGEVHIGTDTILHAAGEISQGNFDLSARTEAQAGALEETASSMEELTSTVRQNADNAKQADKMAMQSSEVAIKGGDAVSQVVDTMEAINESSKKIVDIISVIDGIAFQTNILALNAAVEAARAGEQGRGFAVVASEVRNLAQRSAAAAKEIKELIGNSVEKVDIGSRQVQVAGSTMNEVVMSIKKVTDIMGEITSASQEQSQGIDQINEVITSMDNTTQQNAALVEEAAAASKALSDQANELMKVVSAFKINDSRRVLSNGSNQSGSVRKNLPPVKAAAKPAPRQVAAKKMAPALAQHGNNKSGSEENWEEF
jgi:methyl-accepting chemotaxis protein